MKPHRRIVYIDESRDWHEWAELQKPPVPKYQSRDRSRDRSRAQFWSGVTILIGCGVFWYLFWRAV